MLSSPTELAWAAGFFDGEGTIYVRHTKRHKNGTGKIYPLTTVEVALSQVRPEPLRRFQQIVGAGKFNGPYQPKKQGHSSYYRWNIAGRPSVLRVLTLLWPYLSAPKKEQARRCWSELERLKTKKSPVLKELPA